jgi:hypothetical protein
MATSVSISQGSHRASESAVPLLVRGGERAQHLPVRPNEEIGPHLAGCPQTGRPVAVCGREIRIAATIPMCGIATPRAWRLRH